MAFWVLGGGDSSLPRVGNASPPHHHHHHHEQQQQQRQRHDGAALRWAAYPDSGPTGHPEAGGDGDVGQSRHCHGGDAGLPKWSATLPWTGSSGHDYMSRYAVHNNHQRNQQRPLRQRHHHHCHEHSSEFAADLSHSVPVNNLAFLVIREGDSSPPDLVPSPSPSPELPQLLFRSSSEQGNHHLHFGNGMPEPFSRPGTAPCPMATLPMERTESGLSISSSASAGDSLSDNDNPLPPGVTLLSDHSAARFVRSHVASFRRRFPDSQPERILRALISPRTRGTDWPLDNDALRSIFSAANELFFASRLTRRVTWDWSHPDWGQYDSHIVGTTALRPCTRLGGWETLIVLSSPILRDTKYNRRLLITTFLHEMIHSFMFVMCGLKARESGGHTEGFRQIAVVIDEWAGREFLHMGDMEADLERFRGNVCSPLDEANGAHAKTMGLEQRGADGARDEYLMEPTPLPEQYGQHGDNYVHGYHTDHQRYDEAAYGDWEWQPREDFGARDPPMSSGASYVY
ncbi:metallopeptidase [Purpureocillium lavendulum]|uniref:Metallopeptidase n=1 Tax=Purpureocillium lavendulum TaxID=1247861 RepID=A0AB34FW10_9HYPO|nr:metallopeptidase [Purpureocillium lavendulum]